MAYSSGIGYSGFGGYGNFGQYGTLPVYAAPVYAPPFYQEVKPFETPRVEEPKAPIQRLSNPSDKSASILVKVPVNAKVYIDNNLMQSSATERIFTSPILEPGESYFYTLRVVIEQNGKETEQIRKVTVRAGEISRMAFDTINDKIKPDERIIVDASRNSLR